MLFINYHSKMLLKGSCQLFLYISLSLNKIKIELHKMTGTKTMLQNMSKCFNFFFILPKKISILTQKIITIMVLRNQHQNFSDGDGDLLIIHNSNAWFVNIFSPILYNVLIDSIKPNVEKKFKTSLIFYATV